MSDATDPQDDDPHQEIQEMFNQGWVEAKWVTPKEMQEKYGTNDKDKWTLLDKYAAGLCVVMTLYLIAQVLRWLV